MRQIVIISGKGGTGKTVLTGAFAALAENKIIVDCDVDAADLHLLLNPTIKEKHVFKSGFTASIDQKKCIQCLKCIKACRFNAIDDNLSIDPVSCEGCKFCYNLCPTKAIELKENTSGEWFVSDTKFGTFVHAKLGIAEENSGKLVSLIRKQAQQLAVKQNKDLIIIDGAPGIGCPVIACISNVDCVVVVTEPTLSGLHDAKRVIKVAQHFNAPIKLIINKYDLNEDMTKTIMQYCDKNNILVIGKIRFNSAIVESIINAKTIMEYSDSRLNEIKQEIKSIWQRLVT
ncbi:MAG: ATP-binding protein [Gammaproteobacteria bacterium]